MKTNSYSFKKSSLRNSFILLTGMLGFISSAKAQTTIYSTDFGTVANVNPAGWSFTGIDMTISTNTPSTGYAGVSGGAYLGEGNSTAFVNTSGTSFAGSQIGISTATLLVNTTGYSGITVSFGMRKSSAGYNTNATYAFEWSTDNVTFTPIAYTESTAGSWGLASGAGLILPAAADNQPALYLRWTFNRTGTASNYKIDDFSVKGSAAPGAMRITEYMYNAGGSGGAGEYVEFTNIGGTAVDMNNWSFDDSGNTPGAEDLSAFGSVEPGESVIFTELSASAFRSNWNLCTGIKIIGGNTNNLGREDEINLYDGSGTLVDRLTYGDQTFSPGSIRTTTRSGWPNAAGVGTNTITNWTLASVGDAEASYASSLSEIGSPGKSTRATVVFDPCAGGGGGGTPTIVMDVAATTNYLDRAVAVAPASPYGISGVISDPTDPAATLGIDFTINDAETAVGSLTVTATSNRTSIVPNANITISGSGASRNIKITPIAVGYADITITVNDGSQTASYVLEYAASAASATPANTFWHTGISDGSDAFAIDDNFYISGDDELDVLNVYSRSASGLPVAAFDYTNLLSLPDLSKPEVDLEAAAGSTTTPNKIYWLGSMSNGKGPSFDSKPNRNRIFATTYTGTGAATTFTFAGYYGNLKARLLSWGDANGYNFTASAATGVDSKTVSGFAAEGMVFGPDNTTLYIAFRAPLVPVSTRTNAVIAPIVNFETWFNNGAPSGNPTFGSPIELNLGGRGFRDLIRLSNGTYVIVAGNPAGSPLTSAIYKWTGHAADAPILVTTSADGILNLEGVMQMNTGGVLSLNSLQVISDGGDEELYDDGTVAKDFDDLNLRKFRSDKINSIDLCMTTTGDTTATACSSFTWHGTTYTASSTPTHNALSISGCDSIVTLHLTINAPPSSTVTASGSTTFCEGDSVSFSVATGNTYQWQLNGTNISGATAHTFVTDSAGSYSVIITNTSGCTDTSSAQAVTVNALPDNTITTSGAITFCAGDSVTLNAAAGLSYQWQLNGADISGATNAAYTANANGSYSVIVNNASCADTSASTMVTVNTLPSAPVITQIDFVLTSSPATSYQWYLNDTLISGATSQSYTFTEAGDYTVQITNAAGCEAGSAPIAVTMTGIAALANESGNGILIYPNPYSDHASIQLSLTENANVIIEVYSILGEKVETISNDNFGAGTYTFSFSAKQKGYAGGVYLVKTIINNKITVSRIIESK